MVDDVIQVQLLAGVLSKHGVQKGDRVLIYMPMIPEAVVAMMACARLGAIHSLVFGGFASKELATRINHAQVTGTHLRLSNTNRQGHLDQSHLSNTNRQAHLDQSRLSNITGRPTWICHA